MQTNNNDANNHLKRKMDQRIILIDQCIRMSGFDENFIAACDFHLNKVLDQCDPSKIKTKEMYINILMSNLFLDKMDHFPVKRFRSQVDEFTAWPVPLLPSEMFSKIIIPVETRKFIFYRCLQVGDYLDCRVTSSQSNSAEYQLRVIHKYGVCRILDDLNIIVTMRKSDISELPQFLKEFGICQLVRVVVTEKAEEGDETKVYVSVIDNKTDFRLHKPQLGAIPDTLVPAYVLNPHHSDSHASYKDYLNSSRGFYVPPGLLNGIVEGFGIGPRGTYSYFPVDKSFSSIDVNALKKESKLKDVKDYMDIALRDTPNGGIEFAIAAINLAIRSYPKSHPLTKQDKIELSRLYEIKGRIHASENKKMSRDGIIEALKAFNLDRTNDAARVHLIREMTRYFMRCYRQKNYKEASEWASEVLKLDEGNIKASKLMEHLKLKHPSDVEEFDEKSLQELEEKHKAIETELQRYMRLSEGANAPIVPYTFDSSTSSPLPPQ